MAEALRAAEEAIPVERQIGSILGRIISVIRRDVPNPKQIIRTILSRALRNVEQLERVQQEGMFLYLQRLENFIDDEEGVLDVAEPVLVSLYVNIVHASKFLKATASGMPAQQVRDLFLGNQRVITALMAQGVARRAIAALFGGVSAAGIIKISANRKEIVDAVRAFKKPGTRDQKIDRFLQSIKRIRFSKRDLVVLVSIVVVAFAAQPDVVIKREALLARGFQPKAVFDSSGSVF